MRKDFKTGEKQMYEGPKGHEHVVGLKLPTAKSIRMKALGVKNASCQRAGVAEAVSARHEVHTTSFLTERSDIFLWALTNDRRGCHMTTQKPI